MNQSIQLWQKAVQDEVTVMPRTALIADLLLAASNNYVDLVAMQETMSADLRQTFALASEAADAQRDAEMLRNEEFESESRKRSHSPFALDTDRSNASTPSSSVGRFSGSRRPRSPDSRPPEEDSDPEAPEATNLGYVHNSPLVANHLQGKARGGAVRLIEGDGVAAGQTVVMFQKMRNRAGKEYVLVRLASDASDTRQWVPCAHVTSLPALPGGACPDQTRRSLEKDLERGSESPSQSPFEFRAVRAGDAGSTGRREHLGGAQSSSSSGPRISTVAPTATQRAHNPLDDVDLATLLQVLPRTAPAPACTRRCCVLGCCLLVHPMRSVCCCAHCAEWSRTRAIADVSGDLFFRHRRLPANDPPLQARWLLPPSVRPMRTEDVSRRGE